MTDVATVDARLNGFFRPGFVSRERVLMDFEAPTAAPGSLPAESMPPISIRDARELQSTARRDGEFSESGFFDKHSFVLVCHPTAVKNWDKGPAASGTSDFERTYVPEIGTVIRERLLPGANIEIQQSPGLLRRGPGTPNPYYGVGAHQDYGLSADDYEENLAAYGTDESAETWRRIYDRDEVVGFLVINFWRTVHMDEPLAHMPLAVCDPYTVEPDDVLSTGLVNFTPTGRPSNQLALRYNPAQHWYYYPRMTTEEVLAFKNFQCWKSDQRPTLRTCFHSAFDEPHPAERASERQSCEYRVGIFFLNQ